MVGESQSGHSGLLHGKTEQVSVHTIAQADEQIKEPEGTSASAANASEGMAMAPFIQSGCGYVQVFFLSWQGTWLSRGLTSSCLGGSSDLCTHC